MIKSKKVEWHRLTDDIVTDLFENPDLYKINTKEAAEQVVKHFEEALDKDRPIQNRVISFIRGESKLSRGLGAVLDFAAFFVPYGYQINNARDVIKLIVGRKQKQKEKPMLKKILSIKNLVNIRDAQGNLSLEEILATVIQLVIAGAFVWALVHFGIYDQFVALFPPTE